MLFYPPFVKATTGKKIFMMMASFACFPVLLHRIAFVLFFSVPAVKRSRRKWEAGEVRSVEKHLMKFIRTFTVPAKHDCMLCLQNETETLKERTWTDVKNYVRNRITALKRQIST